MPDPRLLALANDCEERAEEILTRAETFHDAGDAQTSCELPAVGGRLEQAAQ